MLSSVKTELPPSSVPNQPDEADIAARAYEIFESKGRVEGAKYLREFIEDVKASGLVQRALEKSGVSGVSIAPAAPTD